MRTIDVTSGERQYLTGVITEVNGKSLANATFRVGIGTDDVAPTNWAAPDTSNVTGATAQVSLLVDSEAKLGTDLILWVRVIDSPETYNLACATESITIT